MPLNALFLSCVCLLSGIAIMGMGGSISAAFTSLARRAGMPPGTTFHSMRHTHASVLLADRWSARAVSARLGHSTVATTLAIYGHLMPGFDGEMAAGFGGAARRMGWSA